MSQHNHVMVIVLRLHINTQGSTTYAHMALTRNTAIDERTRTQTRGGSKTNA